MAKKKTTNSEDNLYEELAEQTGGVVLKNLDNDKYFIDSGNLALNYMCSGKFLGGGFPTGIIEVYGPSSTAKSLLGYTFLGQCQKVGGFAVLEDCERAANKQFAIQAGHLNENRLILHYPFFIEEVEMKIFSVIKAIRAKVNKEVPICIVWDSIGVAPCRREWHETELPDNFTEAQYKKIVGGKEQPGERAKIAGKALRKINPFLDENNATLFIINQTRASIGTYMQDETTAGGGKALPFYANCRLRTSCGKIIEDAKLKIPIGVNLKFKNKKSRSFTPFLKTEGIQLYFDKGINPLGGLLSILINAGRVEAVGKGIYCVNDKWVGVVESEKYTFQSSKERNDVPAKVLLDNPKLIDAENPEQITKYLGVFAEAIELTNSGNIAEKDMDENDDIDDDDTLSKQLDSIMPSDE